MVFVSQQCRRLMAVISRYLRDYCENYPANDDILRAHDFVLAMNRKLLPQSNKIAIRAVTELMFLQSVDEDGLSTDEMEAVLAQIWFIRGTEAINIKVADVYFSMIHRVVNTGISMAQVVYDAVNGLVFLPKIKYDISIMGPVTFRRGINRWKRIIMDIHSEDKATKRISDGRNFIGSRLMSRTFKIDSEKFYLLGPLDNGFVARAIVEFLPKYIHPDDVSNNNVAEALVNGSIPTYKFMYEYIPAAFESILNIISHKVILHDPIDGDGD